MLRLAGAAILMAFSAPAYAADWIFVAHAPSYANISFVDKDSIRDNEAGNTRASMFSLLAKPDDDDTYAYRFEIEVNCRTNESRLVAAEVFDSARKSRGEQSMEAEWSPYEPGTQGASVNDFVCKRGKGGSENGSAGNQLPFDAGKMVLDNLAKAGAK